MMRKMCSLVALSITVLIYLLSPVLGTLSEVTTLALGGHNSGTISAFGDFNADKNSDIFVIENDGKKVSVLLASIESAFKEVKLLPGSARDGRITSVIPADFDGDTQMDLMITRQDKGFTDRSVTVQIYWGSSKNSLEPDPLKLSGTLDDQPLLLDANGDMIPDLMGEQGGQLYFWIFQKDSRTNYTRTEVQNASNTSKLLQPQSSAFVDLNADLSADICVVAQDKIQMWISKDGIFQKDLTVSLPTENLIFGKASFVDFDSDGSIDILLPVCEDKNCSMSAIYVLSNSKWIKLPINFQSGGKRWGFVPANKYPGDIGELPVTLRMGDFNLDSYPDALVVLTDGNSTQKAFLMKNIGCSGSACHGVHRTFSIDWSLSLHPSSEKAIVAAFYDYLENGILDIVLTTYTPIKGYHIHLWKETFVEDACFIKVMVTSGVCSDNCKDNRKPYGINQPGPAVKYNTLDSNGQPQVGTASQLTQSAYLSLHLPYITFGLGQTPNFVDKLVVGIPHPNGTENRQKSWLSVIPNSQVIIIPYPHDKPSRWINKLFVTPSRLVLLTGAALLGTCGFLAALVGILHWREKVEDKKEKLQEAHKFHFDAM